MSGLNSPKKSAKERGIALLVVVSTLALVTSVVVDFQFNSRVDLQLALNARDELQAEYNALSALKMRGLLLKNSRQVSTALQATGIDPTMLPPIGQLLEMVPVECSLMSAIMKKAGAGAGDDNQEATEFFPGECQATSKSEHAKISLGILRSVSSTNRNQVAMLLLGFLSERSMQSYFEQDDAMGSHAENPEELVGAITDWIDQDKNQVVNNVGDEDRFYAYLKDSYKAKNAPFDSTAELQLVHGISDKLYNLLKDRVTVYNSSAQMELATADDISIGVGLCSAVMQGADCSFLLQNGLWTRLKQFRELGGGAFAPMNVALLTTLVQELALPVDTSKLSTVFTDKNSTTWYTISAEGKVGNAQRKLTAVYQTQEGRFYYYRVD